MCQNEERCGLVIVSSLEDSSHMKPAMWIFCAALPHSLTSSDPVIRRGRRAHMEHFTIICVFVYVCCVGIMQQWKAASEHVQRSLILCTCSAAFFLLYVHTDCFGRYRLFTL